jgi:hypothetical protein
MHVELLSGMVPQGKDRVALESALDALSTKVTTMEKILAEIRTW